MKVLVLLAGLALLFSVTGCGGGQHHRPDNEGYGGSYEGPASPSGSGQEEFRGYPDYPDYRY